MNATVRKLAAFAAALAAVLAGGAAAGVLLHPDAPGGKAEARTQAGEQNGRSSGMNGMGAAAAAAGASEHHSGGRSGVRGLAIAQNGMRLVVEDPKLRQGQTRQVHFGIVDDHGRAVRDFDVAHTKRMHLIVVRRDLTGFQHLHPSMSPNGSWATALRVPEPGSYRLFADFSHTGTPTTLAGDLRVDGYAELKALPAPAARQTSDSGYDVSLEPTAARAAQESELRFTVTKHGRPVVVEPYLGADGHLVALRDGDLAFLHVHPSDHRPGDGIRFESTFPTAGAYRLFLQFKHDGKVHTVAFTQQVS